MNVYDGQWGKQVVRFCKDGNKIYNKGRNEMKIVKFLCDGKNCNKEFADKKEAESRMKVAGSVKMLCKPCTDKFEKHMEGFFIK